MTTVGRWGSTQRKWLRSRQAFGEFFPIFRNRWNFRLRNSAAIFSKALRGAGPGGSNTADHVPA